MNMNDNRNEAIKRLATYQSSYLDFTKNVSLVSRQLAFAEGGSFFILKNNASNLQLSLVWIGLLSLVFFFLSDFLQYYRGAVDFKKLIDDVKIEINNDNFSEDLISNQNAKKISDRYFKVSFSLCSYPRRNK